MEGDGAAGPGGRAPPAGAGDVKVTVVMPARNEARNVDSTLESLFAQTRLPDEIILADGCSTDDTVARFLRHKGRGIPLKVVRNETIFIGGGRNAGSRAAANDVIVIMDFGNRAEPGWLAAMVRPFEEDPAVDLVGGWHIPIAEEPFRRVCTAVLEHFRRSLSTEQIQGMITEDSVPGGMCMAYRKGILERAGGFCEWARKGQDRLFGQRVRRIGGKVNITLDAVVHHKMPRSLRQLWQRHYLYSLWVARLGIPNPNLVRFLAVYTVALAIALASIAWPWLLVALAVLSLAYFHRRVWRKMKLFEGPGGERFLLRERLLGIAVLLTADAAILLGGILGSLDRLVRPSWKRRTSLYLEEGS